ncbi:hypothetical protein NQ317_001052 [Molorchus minor]|uniref:Zinc finger C5HC2-type domain-containing protein n=1 Tax=Molorchus minor TaxID=1323400 RepID=A0ABQ9JQL0_9CUCU|nr:hypothetical protein NQ317_001052 [Molorchus minor]
MNLYISMVFDTQEGVTYCLDHAVEMIKNKKSQDKQFYDYKELTDLPDKVKLAIETKSQKKVPNKLVQKL